MATVTEGEGSVTFIGDSVQVRGNLSGDEDLHILGRIEGSIELDRTLVVAQSGVVKAEVSVRNAIISGVVVGNVQASESVEITKEGRMVGDIAAPRIIIVDGASFRGNVDMGDTENMPVRAPRREQPAPRPAVTREPAKPEPAKAETVKAETAKAEPAKPERAAAPEKAEEKAAPAPERAAAAASPPKKSPTFLNPPKAKGLPKKKQKSRVVVKRK